MNKKIKKTKIIKIFGIGFSADDSDAEIEIAVDGNIIYSGTVATDKNKDLEVFLEGSEMGHAEIASWSVPIFAVSRDFKITTKKGCFLYTEILDEFGSPIYEYNNHNEVVISDPNSDIKFNNIPYDTGVPKTFLKSRGQWCIGIPENTVMTCKLNFTWDNFDYPSLDFILYFFENLHVFESPKKNKFVNNFLTVFNGCYQTCSELEENFFKNIKQQIICDSFDKTVLLHSDPNKVLKLFKVKSHLFLEKENYNFLIENELDFLTPKVSFFEGYCVVEKALPLTENMLSKCGIKSVTESNEKIFNARNFEWDIENKTTSKNSALLTHENKIITETIVDNKIENFGILDSKIVILDLSGIRKDFILENLKKIKLTNN